MNGVFVWTMRNAPALLFAIALIVFFGSVGATVAATIKLGDSTSLYAPAAPGLTAMTVLAALVSGMSASIWPLFGAALLWRMDRSNSGVSPEAAE